ncbi:hypothetical protein DXG01_013307 [Tephrocybe rancida]|nr:hypothetical protein DXG01_013307 [Tephrocybe rancida]
MLSFRLKMRNDAVAARAIIDPETYEQQTRLGREIADYVRTNVVQGARIAPTEGASKGHDTFKLRITKDTELGSNESIKNPPPVERSSRSMRKREKSQEHHTSVADVAPHNDTFSSFSQSHLSLNFSKLKKAHRERVLPELKEEDLEESFVRGSGPGGQSINKTENNVQLLHKPTGIRVSCQETRSLTLNRRIARRNLREKLDHIANPGLSKEDFARAKQRERERRRRRKAKKKAEKAVEQDDLEEDDSEDVELSTPEPEALSEPLVAEAEGQAKAEVISDKP